MQRTNPEDSDLVIQQQTTQNSIESRLRISPNKNGSMGLTSLAAMAGNSTLDKPKKFKVSFPMDPRTALMHLAKYLLDIERTEILEYD
jgi:hypothetical protein